MRRFISKQKATRNLRMWNERRNRHINLHRISRKTPNLNEFIHPRRHRSVTARKLRRVKRLITNMDRVELCEWFDLNAIHLASWVSLLFSNSSERYERPDRSRFRKNWCFSILIFFIIHLGAPQSTPSIVQLSPTPDTSGKNAPAVVNESEKLASALPPSPPCVILDDDSSPAPSIDKKSTRQTPTTSAKKSTDTDKSSSKATKRSRESDKALQKDKPSESTETKRKRLTDGLFFCDLERWPTELDFSATFRQLQKGYID